ncbi:hypothetical protein [Propylenella binzhouense]|uniref:DUF3108 domain-containing protein n=1 Tax=Propylenella binzhouense TaxID=2555902 RepID=A0A964WSL2_9HYPH|nr:hypothetical protein [Propylenella binzhouense]MYZ47089.1 hypothetical protein [Propylenella binzhouense]
MGGCHEPGRKRSLRAAAAAGLVLAALGPGAASAVELSAGGLTFSDELGGFRLLSAAGTGRADDPVVVEEEIYEPAAAVLVIRRSPGPEGRPRAGAFPASGFTLLKRVRNATGRVWAGFDLELEEIEGKPSTYADGLSFDQIARRAPDVRSDRFPRNERLFEPADRIRFRSGHVDPDGVVVFRMQITDPTPTAIFYLVQDPQLLYSGTPAPSGLAGLPACLIRRAGGPPQAPGPGPCGSAPPGPPR